MLRAELLRFSRRPCLATRLPRTSGPTTGLGRHPSDTRARSPGRASVPLNLRVRPLIKHVAKISDLFDHGATLQLD